MKLLRQSREEEKREKEFPGTKANIYKGLETGEKKKKEMKAEVQKSPRRLAYSE